MSGWSLLIWVAVFGLIIYFFMIRPNKKRTDDQRNMMNSLQPGTRVMLTSGIFGTIETMGDQQAVIELAPGTAITVVKQAIAKVLTEADEEFEYSDEDGVIESNEPAELTTGATQDATAEASEQTDDEAIIGDDDSASDEVKVEAGEGDELADQDEAWADPAKKSKK